MTFDASLTHRIKSLATALGFDVAGVSEARPRPETRYLREWLRQGYGGAMHYIERRASERVDPRELMPGARSIVSVGLRYAGRDEQTSAPRGVGRVARYAGGEDYHVLMKDRLLALAAGLEVVADRAVEARAYVDTGPVQERVHAAYAGLGWLGKNTCLIHPKLGSYLFLGELITDLPLEPDARIDDQCGTCRACLDACPTDAFAAPYVLDATRCIAYSTIEDPGPVPEDLRESQGAWVFGCDVCQEVCPWNRKPGDPLQGDPLALHERLAPSEPWREPSLAWLLALDDDAWSAATQHTALRRAKRQALVRNAIVAAGNARDEALRPALELHAHGDDVMLAEHARWALERLPIPQTASNLAATPDD